jgi:hypothetical protein
MKTNNYTDIRLNYKSFLDISLGTRRSYFDGEKTGDEKSRDTVPLNKGLHCIHLIRTADPDIVFSYLFTIRYNKHGGGAVISELRSSFDLYSKSPVGGQGPPMGEEAAPESWDTEGHLRETGSHLSLYIVKYIINHLLILEWGPGGHLGLPICYRWFLIAYMDHRCRGY